MSAQVTSNVTACVQEYQWYESNTLFTIGNTYLPNVTEEIGTYWASQVELLTSNRQGTGPTSAVWNLIEACSLCQGGRTASWGSWVSNCSTNDITIGSYPLQLPPSVAISGWAYLDFTSQGTFQLQPAQQAAATVTESKSAAAQTQGSTSVGTTTPTVTSAPGNSSNNAGAIAGGVVGGVVGLALLAILGWFILRKRANEKGDPQPIHESYPGKGYGAQHDQGAGYVVQPYGTGQYTPLPMSQSEGHEPGPVAYEQPYTAGARKPYDPSDPSTFPPIAPLTSSTPQPSSQGHGVSDHGHQQQTRPREYNYVPEV